VAKAEQNAKSLQTQVKLLMAQLATWEARIETKVGARKGALGAQQNTKNLQRKAEVKAENAKQSADEAARKTSRENHLAQIGVNEETEKMGTEVSKWELKQREAIMARQQIEENTKHSLASVTGATSWICFGFRDKVACWFGDSCRFSHGQDSNEKTAPRQNDSWGSTRRGKGPLTAEEGVKAPGEAVADVAARAAREATAEEAREAKVP
jgi:hypothetical protein